VLHRVGTFDAGFAQHVDGLGDDVWVALGIGAERARRGRGQAGEADLVPSVEHGLVLEDGDVVGGPVQVVERQVRRAAVGGVELVPRDRERHPHLDEGQHLPLAHQCDAGAGMVDRPDASEVRGRVVPAVRSGHVHDAPGGEVRGQPLSCLLVDLFPGGRRDRRQLSRQVVHPVTPP